ncbi:MAG: restriction endonuclease subunit S [Paludibacteraceae bacterium]|nr:restriction endonuclease subunit S [Paludibacteraceae bacterium]
MKKEWKIKRLGEVCSITMGQSPSSDTYNDSDGLPFFQGNADFGKIHPKVRVFCNAPIRIAEENDILISVRAPIGAINIADCRCCIGRGLAAIRNLDTTIGAYIYHALIANKEKLIAQGTGSTFKSIGREALKELYIPVPPLSEQEKIVAELDCLSGVIEKKK